MSEQELNLLQLSSCGVTELRARAPQIVRSETGEARLGGIQFDNVPDEALRYTITPAFACSADAAEYPSRMKISRVDPLIQDRLDPFRHRNRSNVPSSADEIDYGPMFFPLLKMFEI